MVMVNVLGTNSIIITPARLLYLSVVIVVVACLSVPYSPLAFLRSYCRGCLLLCAFDIDEGGRWKALETGRAAFRLPVCCVSCCA
jgi:hypothetical protein